MSGTTTKLSVGANERVTKIEAWHNDVDNMWYRLRLTLNTGRTPQPEYDHTPSTGTNTLHIFTISAGQEFVGFYMGGFSSGC